MWDPIRRASQEVKALDAKYQGLVVVEVTLNPDPPREWVALWNPYPPNSSQSLSYAPPRVSGNRVTLRIPDDKVKTAVEALDAQIGCANDYYTAEVLPRLEAAEERKRKEQEEERQRIESARKQLDDLDRPA